MQSVCVRLASSDVDVDPLELGARSGLLWSRHGLVLAGIGSALQVAVERPDGAASAQARLAELAGRNELDLPATGPLHSGRFRLTARLLAC